MYNAFIMSSFNYCNTIWHFCNDGDIIKLEKLQKRALRIIFTDYESNYDTLLQRSGRPLLYVSRLRAVALETYKTIKKQNPQFLQDLFVPKENHYDLRNGSQMIQPNVRTEKYGLNSFRYQGSKLWNSLPPDMKLAASASIFKNLLLKWYGQKCSCGFCILCKINQLWCPILCEDVYRHPINGYRSITFYSFYRMCSCCSCAFYMYCIVTCYDWPPCVVQITNVWMRHACLPIRSKDHTIFHPLYSICTYTHSIFISISYHHTCRLLAYS